jgi:4-amino-4-deoxy-L-arabinose transferase-like glycosyltransferase
MDGDRSSVARILGGGDERLWLAVGVVMGVALQNKQLPLLLVLSLVLGLALDRRLLAVLRSPWLWVGAAVAAAIWLPNLLWQATNGWPQLELAADVRADEAGESRATLLPLQLLLIGRRWYRRCSRRTAGPRPGAAAACADFAYRSHSSPVLGGKP